jgi:hypothetical protein
VGEYVLPTLMTAGFKQIGWIHVLLSAGMCGFVSLAHAEHIVAT